jgi:hypothetical protein
MKFFWLLQPPRSGGTLFLRLLDGSDKIFVFPVALRFKYRIWPNKKKLNKRDYLKIFQLINLKKFIKYGISKQSSNIKQKNHQFIFDIKKHNYQLKKILKRKINLKKFIDSFFLYFFQNWKNYKSKKNKKIIIAHTTLSNPKFFETNFVNFTNTFEDGKIIIIIRKPLAWFNSSKKLRSRSLFMNQTDTYIYKYYLNFFSTVLKCYNSKKIIIISFDDLILKTENTLKKISKLMKIKFSKSMLLPTFNNESTTPNSSFQLNLSGKIYKNVVNRKSFLKINKNTKKLLQQANLVYKKLYEKKI